MSLRRERKNRDWILAQLKNAPEEEITLTGYLNLNPNSNWITFTQVENENGDRISGHINLPKSKVIKLFSNIEEFNHKPFFIKGKPSYYSSKGVKRGCIDLTELINR